MAKHSELSPAQRREVVLALLRREEPAAVLARRYGISEGTLFRWWDEFLAGGEATISHGKKGADAREREIKEPSNAEDGRSLLAVVQEPARGQAIAGRVSSPVQWSASALGVGSRI